MSVRGNKNNRRNAKKQKKKQKNKTKTEKNNGDRSYSERVRAK